MVHVVISSLSLVVDNVVTVVLTYGEVRREEERRGEVR